MNRLCYAKQWKKVFPGLVLQICFASYSCNLKHECCLAVNKLFSRNPNLFSFRGSLIRCKPSMQTICTHLLRVIRAVHVILISQFLDDSLGLLGGHQGRMLLDPAAHRRARPRLRDLQHRHIRIIGWKNVNKNICEPCFTYFNSVLNVFL